MERQHDTREPTRSLYVEQRMSVAWYDIPITVSAVSEWDMTLHCQFVRPHPHSVGLLAPYKHKHVPSMMLHSFILLQIAFLQ